MITSSYSQSAYYTGSIPNIANRSIPTTASTTTGSIPRAGYVNMMNPSSTESLEHLTGGRIVYVSSHTSAGTNSHAWQGWSEAAHSASRDGGAVRTAILSGSYGQLKKLRVDSEINSETLTTSWSSSIGENLKVGNAASIEGYLQIGTTKSLEPGASEPKSPITSSSTTANGVSNVRFLVATGNSLLSGSLFVSGNNSTSGSLNVKGRARVTGALQVVGNAAVTGNLDVGGNESITGSLHVSKSIYGSENLHITGDVGVSGGLHVSGTAYFHSNSYVDHSASVRDLTVRNNTNLQGKLTVTGKSIFNDDVDVYGNLLVSGTVTYLNTEELYVKDKSITVASGAVEPGEAEGAGFDIAGAGVEFHYNAAQDKMTLNKGLNITGSLNVSNSVVSPLLSASKVVATTVTASNVKVTNTASIAQANVTNLGATGNISGSASGSFKDLSVANKTTSKYVTIQGAVGQNALTINNGNLSAPNSNVTVNNITGSNISMNGVVSASTFVGDGSGLTNITASIVEATTVVQTFQSRSATERYWFTHNLNTENVFVALYRNLDIPDPEHSGSNFNKPVQIIPERLAIIDSGTIEVVFGRAIESGSIVIAKAGHIVDPWDLYADDFLTQYDIHYGRTGSWDAEKFSSTTCSANIVSVAEYVDTPRIGNLVKGPQYYTPTQSVWDSFIEFRGKNGVATPSIDFCFYNSSSQTNVTASTLKDTGDLYIKGDLHTNHVFQTSDQRFKTNIRPIENALESLKKIPGVRFNWKGSGEPGIGTLAQAVQTVYPELTKTVTDLDGNEKLTVDYQGLVGVLLAAVKELSDRVEQLEGKQ